MKKNKRLNPLDEKFKKDELKFEVITNDNLICKDCEYKYDDKGMPCNTSKCKKYDLKPDEVLNGGDCIDYSKE